MKRPLLPPLLADVNWDEETGNVGVGVVGPEIKQECIQVVHECSHKLKTSHQRRKIKNKIF